MPTNVRKLLHSNEQQNRGHDGPAED
jgi:hypothetical protein